MHNQLVVPLAHCLGDDVAPLRQEAVETREGAEDGGWLLATPDGTRLRSWTIGADTDLDAPARGGRAYRFSPARCAQRVLLASGEAVGLIATAEELRLLLCDPARPDSHVVIRLANWRTQRAPPDSFRLLLALASPAGLAALPDILDAARLSQARVTRDLRVQTRAAIEAFLQGVLDAPANAARLAELERDALPKVLWQESLLLIYRLLFILKMEAAADPARAFSFVATRLWRQSLSPNLALAPLVRRQIDHGHETGRMLEDGLRAVFRAFREGLACSELRLAPLQGALFGAGSMPVLERMCWGEHGVALLLDRLLWTSPRAGARERVHYGGLDVEELGRVYEALLELEPGIARTRMLRVRRARIEAVLPAADHPAGADAAETIAPGRFFLCAGAGRKATGSYYTPHAFVRFLVRETLLPQISERSPDGDPQPNAILALKVVDPATGSGHFLVEACRFLGEALYAACRLCDELAAAAELAAQRADGSHRIMLLQRAAALRDRLAALPDSEGALLSYLPNRACESGGSGISESRALAYCRRLVAVHCLYGVDRNALAIELAKVSLWLESYAEGLPLTFLDHRLVQGDSIAGPFGAELATLPVSGKMLAGVVTFGIAERLQAATECARREVVRLEASIGRDAADLALKESAKARLDTVLAPLRALARAWAGAAGLGTPACDAAWLTLARHVADHDAWPAHLTDTQRAIVQAGAAALPWDLTFPEVFASGAGFDVVLGNPPWDVVQHNTRDFVAGFDPRVKDAPTRQQADRIARRVLADPAVAQRFDAYKAAFQQQKRLARRLFQHQAMALGTALTAGNLDTFRLFAERKQQLIGDGGAIGMVVPSAFHANEGTTALRRLYFERTCLALCLCFENRRKLFDIDSRFKFALIVARAPGPTRTLRCAFYLDSFAQVGETARILDYDMDFIRAASGEHLALPELRGRDDLAVARRIFLGHETLGRWCDDRGIAFGRDMHMTDDAACFVPLDGNRGRVRAAVPKGHLLLHEGKTFHQFTDRWDTPPRYAVPAQALQRKPATQAAFRHFRLVFRDVARSSDERTLIAAIAPSGVVFGHTANTERTPQRRGNGAALLLCALLNSFPLDWAVRQKAAAHLSLFIVQSLPLPALSDDAERLLRHGALRLSCNHAGYAALWRDQLGQAWREEHGGAPRWPVLADPAQRWRLRAAMDAVVAHAFGLERAAYVQVLRGFSHKSFPAAREWCLRAFDALAEAGPAAFCRMHDPYWDTAVARPERPAAWGAAPG